MKTYVSVPSKSNEQKTSKKKNLFLLASCQPLKEKAGSGSASRSESEFGPIQKSVVRICWSGSVQKNINPQHCIFKTRHHFFLSNEAFSWCRAEVSGDSKLINVGTQCKSKCVLSTNTEKMGHQRHEDAFISFFIENEKKNLEAKST
jgi:hypothetical protein